MQAIKQYAVPFVLSNLVFGLALLAAMKRPMVARLFFVVAFLGAGIFNTWTAIKDPVAYLTYADTTPVRFYEEFIRGYFSAHVQEFVIIIAAGQILVGLALVLDKRWTRLGCLGGMIFGVAIAPLGIGSAFPSTIVMSLAFLVLILKSPHDFVWNWSQYRRNLITTAPSGL